VAVEPVNALLHAGKAQTWPTAVPRRVNAGAIF
jgi:hypothetical protein